MWLPSEDLAPGAIITIKHDLDLTDTIRVRCDGTNGIDYENYYILDRVGSTITFHCDGHNWFIMSKYDPIYWYDVTGSSYWTLNAGTGSFDGDFWNVPAGGFIDLTVDADTIGPWNFQKTRIRLTGAALNWGDQGQQSGQLDGVMIFDYLGTPQQFPGQYNPGVLQLNIFNGINNNLILTNHSANSFQWQKIEVAF